MIIDMHAHVVPEHFPPAGNRAGAARLPSMDHFEPGRAKVMIAGENFRTVADVCWDPVRRAASLTQEGADAQVISPMPELLSYWFTPEDGLEFARYTNEFITGLVQSSPRHFYGLGMVPRQDPELAAKELANIRGMGLLGVELGSNILGKSLGEPRFLPRLDHSWSGTWNGEPSDPDRPVRGDLRNVLPRSPREYARELYYDTLLFDGWAIRYLGDIVGSSHLLVGTDFPFVPRERPVGKTLRSLGFSDEEMEDITWRNCLRFLGLKAPVA